LGKPKCLKGVVEVVDGVAGDARGYLAVPWMSWANNLHVVFEGGLLGPFHALLAEVLKQLVVTMPARAAATVEVLGLLGGRVKLDALRQKHWRYSYS
jgi:hypothetical protein